MNDRTIEIAEIQEVLLSGTIYKIRQLLKNVHEADIAEALESLTRNQRIQFFKKVKPELVVDVFEEIRNPVQIEVLQEVQSERAASIVEKMEMDDAADVLQDLKEEDKKRAAEIIQNIKDQVEVTELLKHPETSAGGIMNPSYVAIPENLTVKQAISQFRKTVSAERDFTYYIYVIDEDNHLMGVANLRDLIMAKESQKIKEIRNENIISVSTDTDQEEAAQLIAKYDFLALPVTNDSGKMVGIITVDDIVDVIQEEATEDILKLTGAGGELNEDDILGGDILNAAKSRFQWLFLTMLGGLLSGLILTFFARSFGSHYLFLTIMLGFIPLLIGLGGNIGNQSATIMVRGLAMGYVKQSDVFGKVLREIGVGLIIGLGIGAILLFGTWLIYQTPYYGIMVATAIILNVVFSSALGTMLPIFFTRIGIDPAVASAPFISSTIDVIGLVVYFFVIQTFLLFTPFQSII